MIPTRPFIISLTFVTGQRNAVFNTCTIIYIHFVPVPSNYNDHKEEMMAAAFRASGLQPGTFTGRSLSEIACDYVRAKRQREVEEREERRLADEMRRRRYIRRLEKIY